MLIVSPEFRCSNEILTIVAMLSGELNVYRLCVYLTPFNSAERVDSSSKHAQRGRSGKEATRSTRWRSSHLAKCLQQLCTE